MENIKLVKLMDDYDMDMQAILIFKENADIEQMKVDLLELDRQEDDYYMNVKEIVESYGAIIVENMETIYF